MARSSNASPAGVRGDARRSIFADPLESWANDDILLTAAARDRLAAEHPRALRVLDWPELRTLFNDYEEPANQQASAERRLGLLSVVAGVVGLSTAALAPLVPIGGRYLGMAAVASIVVAVGLALRQRAPGRSKSRRLRSRFWTERARALYFQVLINNLDLAARAMTDDAALALWKRMRAAALGTLPRARDLPARIRELIDDAAEQGLWIVPAWSTAPALPTPTSELEVILRRLRAQRFDVQIAYTGYKLGDSLATPRRRAALLKIAADLLTGLALVYAVGTGLLLATHAPATGFLVRLSVALTALASAGVVGLRAFNDGLLFSSDLSRYAWYNAAALQARTQFDAGDLYAKVDALRAMEAIAYRDLRDFITTHQGGRFAIQT